MLICIGLLYVQAVLTMGLKGGNDMQLGERLQKIRSDNNLTQDELAGMLHVTRQTVSCWENGKSEPDIDTLMKISTIFDNSSTVAFSVPKAILSHPKASRIFTAFFAKYSADAVA